MPFIEVNGAALRYQLSGAGPTAIILVHEMGGTLESWDEVAPRLALGRRVLRLDTRGAGLSEKLRGTASIDLLADDIAALAAALDLPSRTAIAGIAVGAAIAIRHASRHAGRTSALIAMGPATGIPTERRTTTLAQADALEVGGMRPGMDAGLKPTYPEIMRHDGARFERVRAQRLGNDPASYAAVLRMLAGLDMVGDLAAIRCPTLVLSGRHDGLRPPADGERIARAIAGARFEALETAHFMASQTPGLVAGRIEAFLDEVGC